MSSAAGHNTVTDGLVLCLDATDIRSYSGSGTTWYDRSTNGNNGTLTNGPIYSSADGGAIVFDGSNDYVDITWGIMTGNSAYTYDLFFKKRSDINSNWISYGSSSASQLNQIGIFNNTIGILNYANDTAISVSSIASNTWYHLCATHDGSTSKVYFNGVLAVQKATTYNFGSSNLNIGRAINSSNYSPISIGNVRIYNKALSQAEVLQNYNAQKARYQAIAAQFSPLQLSPALWLDASDATTLYDATVGGNFVAADGVVARWEDKSGNARHATQATLANRPQRKIGVKNGKDIIRFNGSNFLTTANVATTSTSYTIITVSSTTNLSSGQCIAYNGLAASNGFGHFCYQSKATVLHGGILVIPDGNLNTSTEIWSSVRESNSLNFWRNGNLQLTSTVSVNQPTGNVLIGDTELNNGPLIGDIIEIYIFSSPLTTDNRKNLERYLGAKYAITVS